ncbi:HAMP domain-containing protein [Novosphingobium sp. YJ-S2-02]|uniref:histidine kinase n=1 Tax=Novosphingobium aureum TaxID=2792964 RepID=A0A931HDY0_9SPHN|nr:HAMP domain-containing sensor histidine kinase [Novosphingobium aureum]MBH0114345.1 HAMP domain-containing protein [Novosphingobium aureum]
MRRLALPRARSLPLALQMIAIPVCALVAAQLVTLALTVLIPPRPTARWNLDDVAAALAEGTIPDALERRDMTGPPDISGQGWLVSESSRNALAARLDMAPGDIVLAFYTQLPVGGVAVPTSTRSPLAQMDTDSSATADLSSWLIESAKAQAIPGGPPPGGGGAPGGLPPGGFPGGMPPGARPARVPTMPSGTIPGGARPAGTMPGGTGAGAMRPPTAAPATRAPGAHSPGGQPPGNRPGPASPPAGPAQGEQPPSGPSGGMTEGPSAGTGAGYDPAAPGTPGGSNASASEARPGGSTPGMAPPGTGAPGMGTGSLTAGGLPPGIGASQSLRAPLVDFAPSSPPATRTAGSDQAPRADSATARPMETHAPAVPAQTVALEPPGEDAEARAGDADAAVTGSPAGTAQPIPFRRQHDSIFNLASPPFIEGDFVAAARQGDGSWIAVAPREEPFPNAWQRRVIVWFALSLAIISPLAWLFARRIVLPLREFASAAEQLGRDPSAQIPPLSGPAEIGGAAIAFNQMRNRVRAFVEDRTTMVGAISHDLRTPLTRLRFRIEDVPDDQRGGLLKEVTEMEAMISQVIAFIHDASAPGARERVLLGDLVAQSIEDARLVGADVTLAAGVAVVVDVDPVGMRRLLDNLVENAVKYGERACVRLDFRAGEAIVEIVDDGEGFAEAEFDLVFEPFYRSASARKSAKKGSGLGLAVCRSIARAHGGDVSFAHDPAGFITRLRLPATATSTSRKAG